MKDIKKHRENKLDRDEPLFILFDNYSTKLCSEKNHISGV